LNFCFLKSLWLKILDWREAFIIFIYKYDT
jgi:hypothetical protein